MDLAAFRPRPGDRAFRWLVLLGLVLVLLLEDWSIGFAYARGDMSRAALYGWLAFVHLFLALVAYGFMESRSNQDPGRG